MCLLHLHGPSSWSGSGARPNFASFYSQSSAPGVIMATGSIGKYLSFDPRQVNTYLSRDGGESWDEIRKGPYIYEYGDSGAVLLMARAAAQGDTSELLFSLDLGVCWEGPIKLSQPMSVDNIRVEPMGASRVFVVHGSVVNPAQQGAKLGALAVVDFRVLPFTSPIGACDPLSDYEMWSPRHCLVGATVKIQRRKRTSRCFNSLSFNRTFSSTPCTCALADDFECEFGAERAVNGPAVPCTPIPGFDPATCPLVGGGKAPPLSRTFYRLVSHDVCNDSNGIIDRGGGGKPGGDGGRGGRRRGGGMGGGAIAAIIIAVFLVCACAAACFIARIRDAMVAVAAALFGCLADAWSWARDRLTGGVSSDGYHRPHADSEFALEEADKYSPPEMRD